MRRGRIDGPDGRSENGVLRPDFERRLMIHFRGSVVTSDAGLLAYRELDDALGLSESANERLADARTRKNGRHALVSMLRAIRLPANQILQARIADLLTRSVGRPPHYVLRF